MGGSHGAMGAMPPCRVVGQGTRIWDGRAKSVNTKRSLGKSQRGKDTRNCQNVEPSWELYQER